MEESRVSYQKLFLCVCVCVLEGLVGGFVSCLLGADSVSCRAADNITTLQLQLEKVPSQHQRKQLPSIRSVTETHASVTPDPLAILHGFNQL